LYELVSGDNQEKISANIFGREFSAQSRAFKYLMNHMYDNFHHLVHDNLSWFYRNGLFEKSAEAIGEKMNLQDGVQNLIALFIDCNCLQTSVTGGKYEVPTLVCFTILIQNKMYRWAC